MTGGKWSRRGIGVFMGLMLPLAAMGTAGPALAKGKPGTGGGGGGTATTFSGRATVVDATALGAHVAVSDTGDLPATGGEREASLLDVDVTVGGLARIEAEVAHAATVGMGNRSRAVASLAELSLGVAHTIRLNAGLVQSRAEAACVNGAASLKGSSQILNLSVSLGVGGLLWLPPVNVTVDGSVNQTVNLGVAGISLVLNEQTRTTNAIDVNAIHLRVDGLADVVVSHSHADINCGSRPGCDAAGDFVTGGGFINIPQKANFAIAGGKDKGGKLWWGHLQYNDHNGIKVHGTSITGYSAVGTSTTRVITGVAEINGSGSHTFKVTVADNGEPGRDDTFSLVLDTGYTAGGTLGGGNIQLHKPDGCTR